MACIPPLIRLNVDPLPARRFIHTPILFPLQFLGCCETLFATAGLRGAPRPQIVKNPGFLQLFETNTTGLAVHSSAPRTRQTMKHSKVHARATERIPYTLYHGTFIHAPQLGELEIITDALVGVDLSGEIDFLSRDFGGGSHKEAVLFYEQRYRRPHDHNGRSDQGCDDYTRYRYVDVSKDPLKFFLPGFVDTHIHASQYPNAGIGLESLLLDWLTDYTFPMESKFTDANKDKMELAKTVYGKVIDRTLRSGTTCASYFTTTDPHTSNLFAELCLTAGQRSFVGKVCMDHNETYPAYEESFEECQSSMNSMVKYISSINPPNETLVRPIITPRFAPVCTRKLLKWLGAFALEHNLPIQTHIAESKNEVKLVADLFPECDNYATVYSDHDLLTNTTILAHAVHLTKPERNLIKRHKCSVSHCPTSNSFLTSGEAPVKKYLHEDKINVSLGTDVSGGFDSSILTIMRQAILVSHHLAMKSLDYDAKLTLAEVIYMATTAGAKAVGLGAEIGSFEVGKRWDAQLIDLSAPNSNVDVFSWQAKPDIKSITDLVGKWIFGGDDRNCVKVWCNGRLVVDKSRDEWVFVKDEGQR